PERIPADYNENHVFEFLKDIIDATHDIAAAFKPNLAFFEALGPSGFEIFNEIILYIRRNSNHPLIIADAKRGDIGNTARQYAKAFFEILNCDGITLNPYMGMDTIEAFTDYKDKASILLCLTSNPGAKDFELHGHPPLYEKVAMEAARLNEKNGNVWLVVGATKDSESIRKIQDIAGDLPFLIPGIGAQGGDLKTILEIKGKHCLINSSRNILYSSDSRKLVREAARREAETINEQVRKFISF
ncbi:MAG: orotidine-5'-phosphate decarboxylase, partial [Spirochaetia bacterium]|nr:orotidine-5'-phosphate decarboxylase [Spirochaetia bacterium]